MLKKLLFCLLCLAITRLQSQNLTITNVNVIPIEGSEVILKNQTVYIKDGRIEDIVPFKQKQTANKLESIIDGTGKYLIPGLADMHVHFPDPKDISLEQFFKWNLAAGVTAMRSMRGESRHLTLRDSIQKKLILAPQLYISIALPADSTVTATDLRTFVEKARNEKWDFVKYLSGLTPALFDSAALYCKQNNIKLAGHVFNSDLQTAIKNSQASVEHYQPVLKEYRKDTTHFANVTAQLKNKNIFVCPTLSFYFIWGKQFSNQELDQRNGIGVIPPELKNKWHKEYQDYFRSFDTPAKQMELDRALLKTRKNLTEFNHVLKKLNDDKVMLLLSPDESAYNVPGFALVEEMKLYKKAGLSNYDILRIATWNAAAFFDAQGEWGSIAKGKKAHLVLLDKNPLDNIENVKTVNGTVLDGKFYKPSVLLSKK